MLNAIIDLHLHKFQFPISDDIRKNIYLDNIKPGCKLNTSITINRETIYAKLGSICIHGLPTVPPYN